MPTFESAIPVIMAHEGGWVHNLADPGGETMMGWSMLTIKRLGLTPKDLGLDIPAFVPGCLKSVTKDVCRGLYRKFFWDKYGYGSISDPKVATKVFDCAVNCGPARAHAMVQRAATVCGHALVDDGVLGPKSVAGINSCEPVALVKAMAEQMRTYYTLIATKRPSLQVFLKNWIHRANWGT